jgi:hypothetical protein
MIIVIVFSNESHFRRAFYGSKPLFDADKIVRIEKGALTYHVDYRLYD